MKYGMGNSLSSKTKSIENANAKLERELQSLRSVSMETLKKMKEELNLQRRTIEMLRKANSELMKDDNICTSTKKQLESVLGVNEDLVAKVKNLNEDHAKTVRALTAAKERALTELKASATNERVHSSLEVKLVQAKNEISECKSREKITQEELAKSKSAVKKLMNNKAVLTRQINAMITSSTKKDTEFKNELKKRDHLVHELRSTRPIVIDRINNTFYAHKSQVGYESVKVTFSRIDVRDTAMGYIWVSLVRSDGIFKSREVRFSGTDSLNVIAEKFTKGSNVIGTLGDVPIVRVRKTPFLRNGWVFEFTVPPQGGIFASISIGVRGDNTGYGLSGIQLLGKPIKKS